MPQCHLSDRSLVRLSGPDVRPFLQGLLTADVNLLTPQAPLYAGLLSPQGKTLFDLFLFADAEDVLLDTDAPRAEALAKRLTMFRLRRKVEIAAEPALQVHQSWGKDGNDPRFPAAGTRTLAPAGTASDATLEHWHAHRLPLGLPASDELGSDDLLWLETNARELNGVSFTKGCYTGQENTARMHHRDKLRKRLLPLSTTAEGPVMAGEKQAGELRGAPHAGLRMALIRMDFAHHPLTVANHPAPLHRPPWLPAGD